MNSRVVSYIALLVSVASFGYAVWLHQNIDSIAQAALRQRETELVHHWTPHMLEFYRGLGISENKLPKSPQTLEELMQPWADTISKMESDSEESTQSSNTVDMLNTMENTTEPTQSGDTVTNAKK
jgi:hypothetical protein